MVTSLLLAITWEHRSMAATAKLCPNPMLSDLALSIAEVESTKIVYRRPLSYLRSKTSRA